MSRILAYAYPSPGQLFPLVPILDELRRRGHEVVLREGPANVELAMDDWRARTPPGAVVRAARRFADRSRADADELGRVIDEVRPDALIVDVAAWGALAAAEAWRGPWAASCPFPLPLGSWFGLERLVLPPLNSVRRELGLAPIRRGAEIFRAAPLSLYMTAEPFERRRRDWPDGIVMVGPCQWEPAGELPSELDAVEAPLVLVSTSTEFQDDGRLVATALRALEAERCHVVATVPAAQTASPPPTANATVLRFAPHGPILARAACAITHGGMGVTQKALASGVPVCAVPFGRDQYEVAARVVRAGAGTRLPAPLLRPELLRRQVRRAVARRAAAERLARGFAAAGGPPAAADAFERCLA